MSPSWLGCSTIYVHLALISTSCLWHWRCTVGTANLRSIVLGQWTLPISGAQRKRAIYEPLAPKSMVLSMAPTRPSMDLRPVSFSKGGGGYIQMKSKRTNVTCGPSAFCTIRRVWRHVLGSSSTKACTTCW